MNAPGEITLALFYCGQVLGSVEEERRAMEVKYGTAVRLFPLPCSGRLEPLHLLKALEEFADAAYLIACPEGTCRYFEGNLRARKRVETVRNMIVAIGLEGDRVGIVVQSGTDPKPLAEQVEGIVERIAPLGCSAVRRAVGSKE